MKLKIKCIIKRNYCMPEQHGDWIDLKLAEDTFLIPIQAGTYKKSIGRRDVTAEVTLLSLGVAMQLPKGFEAILAPRSSTSLKLGLLCANSFGIIDEDYCGNEDIWKFPVIATKPVQLAYGMRVAQFRIQPKQNASVWTKLKWLFSSGVEIELVDSLDNKNRGGLGSTGQK